MGILALNLEKIGTSAHPPLYNMWASLITLTFVAILGHSSAFGIHQSLPWNTYDTSSLLHSQKQCVQQVIDADSLLKIITKIVDDIPNICLSKFKMCGGFETPSPYPPPPLDFPEFRSSEDRSPQSNDIPSEEEVVEEVFEDGNGTENSSASVNIWIRRSWLRSCWIRRLWSRRIRKIRLWRFRLWWIRRLRIQTLLPQFKLLCS